MLDEMDKIALLKLARLTLESHLVDGTTPTYHTSRASLLEKKGAFVSLHDKEDLRGCIGQLYPDRELYKIVQHCVVSAALEDSRFLQVRLEELPDLNIEISVLTPFRRIRDVEEIQVGKHGIYIVQGSFRGLLLPQVATSYGWDKRTFLEQTCRKAGLAESGWRDERSIIHTFEAEVFDEQAFSKTEASM
jgi:AmmeMemoRadiSam system protein A